MSQTPRQPESPPLPASVERGHEPDRMPLRWLVIGVAVLIVGAVVVHLVLSRFLRHEARAPRDVDRPGSIVTALPPINSADQPALQPEPANDNKPEDDLAAMYRDENRVFGAMGWKVDEGTNGVKPPDSIIERINAGAAAARRQRMNRPAGPAPTSSRVVTPVPGVDQGRAR